MSNKEFIETLNPRHFKILDLSLLGWTPMQIAKQLKMSNKQVCVVTNSPSFRHQLAMKRQLYEENAATEHVEDDKRATDLLKESAKLAAEKLVHHLESVDEKISIRASESILDRAGCPKAASVNTQQNIGPVFMISTKEASRIVEAIELSTEQAEPANDKSSDLTGVDSEPDTAQPVLSSQKELTATPVSGE